MDIQTLDQAFAAVTQQLDLEQPEKVMILGSGWSEVAEAFDIQATLDYQQIPGLGATGVQGHKGRLIVARTENNQSILIFQGRRHWYEGQGWTPVAIPVYIALKAGVSELWLTNAAGGVTPQWSPGELMLITDHINAMGSNPLIGAHHEVWGARFPDQTRVYDPKLLARLRNAAKKAEIELREGIYLATSGPVYETPAEIRLFRHQGADAVGMSTVPEALLANAAGMSVCAVSCITNHAAGVSDSPLAHQEVLDVTSRVMPLMSQLLQNAITPQA